MAHFKVYEPCELAQELYKMRSFDLTENLDTLLCVASHHDFNTTSVRLTPDGVRHYGIFGLPLDLDGYRKSVLGQLREEAVIFLYNALFVGGKPNSLASNFYKQICSYPTVSVRLVSCHLDEYLIGDIVFELPIQKNLYSKFQYPNKTYCVPKSDTC